MKTMRQHELNENLTEWLRFVQTTQEKIVVTHTQNRITGLLIPLDCLTSEMAQQSQEIGICQFRDRCGSTFHVIPRELNSFVVTRHKKPMVAFVKAQFARELGVLPEVQS